MPKANFFQAIIKNLRISWYRINVRSKKKINPSVIGLLGWHNKKGGHLWKKNHVWKSLIKSQQYKAEKVCAWEELCRCTLDSFFQTRVGVYFQFPSSSKVLSQVSFLWNINVLLVNCLLFSILFSVRFRHKLMIVHDNRVDEEKLFLNVQTESS